MSCGYEFMFTIKYDVEEFFFNRDICFQGHCCVERVHFNRDLYVFRQPFIRSDCLREKAVCYNIPLVGRK